MSLISLLKRALAGGILAAPLAACEADPDRLRVTVCGDLRLGVHVDAIRVTVRDEDRSLAYSGLDELVPPGDAALADPADAGAPDAAVAEGPACGAGPFLAADLRLPPGQGRAWVEVQALREGLQTAVAEVRAGGDAVVVALTQDCLGVICPLGQTCVRAACTLVPVDGDLANCEGPCAR